MDWFNPFEGSEGGGGGSGTDNYNELINKPSINNVVLSGNKTGDDLGLQGKISSSNKISSDNVNDSGAQNLFTNATEKQTWNAKQDAIQNLQDIQSGAALGATSLQPSDVKSTYSSTGTDPVSGTAVAAALGTLDVESVGGAGKYISAISETDGKISATAETMDSTPTSSSTKVVTSDGIYEYVNSSVATNTAYFIGTFDSVEELEAYSGIITNNDYAFVTSTDSSGNTLYNRYKYNGSTHTWSFEYALNNSSFTSAQWATIQSGLTSSDKTKLDGIQSGANKTIVDSAMSSSSTNPVQNKVVNTALEGKQNTLTFDSTPTDSSTNPVTSGGIYTDQQRQEAEIGVVANAGAKNLLKITASSQTHKGVTFTINDDQTVTVNGTNDGTGASTFVIVPNEQAITIPDGNYILSGCPTGGGASVPFDLRWYMYSSGKSAYDSGKGTSIEKSGNTEGSNIAIVVKSGQTANNLTFKPMLRPAAITDPTYVPYALPNPTLTPAAIKAVDEGAKNLLRNTVSSQVVGGVTFTVNADGTIIANGTKTNNDWLYLSTGNSLVAGTYVLSSGLAPQSDVSLRLLIATADSLGSAIMITEGERQVHIKQLTSDYTGLNYAIRISSGTTLNNLVFKPMLCTAADYAISQKFVPYCPTNRELYETKVTMQQAYGDAIPIPANSDLNNYTTPGLYYALVADVSTIINTPYNATGLRLVVEKNTPSGAAAFQTIYPTSRSHLEFFRRVYEGGVWSDWYKFEGTKVTS